MTWNHRVIRREYQLPGGVVDVWFGIHECFYNNPEDEIPHSWTEDAIAPIGETPAELLETILRFKKTLDKPILEIDGDKLKIWNPEKNHASDPD